MADLDFGRQLRIFRLQSIHPATGKPLSQQQIGELMQDELGTRYSGAAISDWELNKSTIHVNDRTLLISLLKILKQHGGIKSVADADALLESGNYRRLNGSEMGKIFSDQEIEHDKKNQLSASPLTEKGMPPNALHEIQRLFDDAGKGPSPAGLQVTVSLIRKMTDQLSVLHVVKAMVWLWILAIAHLLLSPSLQWLFATEREFFQSMILYAAGAIVLPPMIGAVVNTRTNAFWVKQTSVTPFVLRLFVHQGAYVGFHVGYFIVFLLTVMQNQLQIQSAAWVEFAKMLPPIAIGYAAAQLVPHNLWLAYGRLHLKDGAVYFFFVLLGPLWAYFFVQVHKTMTSPIMLTILVLTAITMLAIMEVMKGRASAKKWD